MRIVDGAQIPYACPFAETYRTATATHDTREGQLVHVATDAGVLGLGEAAPLSNRTEPLKHTRATLARALDRLEDENRTVEQALADLDDLAGEARAARFGLSLALADALAKHEQLPLAAHLVDRYDLEAPPTDEVPVNATIPDASPEQTRVKAREAAEQGFTTIKLKAGRGDLAHDLDRLDAVEDAAPDAEIRLDANGAWSLDEARRALEAMASYPLDYVEQPLPPDELQKMARLRNEADVPIAADEPAKDPASARATLLARCCDVLVVKPMVLGGVDRALAVTELARREAVDVVVTTTIDTAVARAGALHIAAALPDTGRAHGLATGWMLDEDPASFDERITDGHLRVPTEHGHGARREAGDTTVRYTEEA